MLTRQAWFFCCFSCVLRLSLIPFVVFHGGPVGLPGGGSGAVDSTLNPKRPYTDEGQVAHTYGVLRIEGDTGNLVLQFQDAAGGDRPGARLALEPRR